MHSPASHAPPSTILAPSHQGQGVQPQLVAAHGAAGRLPQHKGLWEQQVPSSSLATAWEGAGGCRGGPGETAQAAQIDCDSPRKAEPGGAEKYKLVSFSLPYAPLQLWAAR